MSIESGAPLRLPDSCSAWGTAAFAAVLRAELEAAGAAALPLQQGLTRSSQATDDAIQVMVIEAHGGAGSIRARVGVFYAGVTAGCQCADDPTPVAPQAEYCELCLEIDRASAAAIVTPAAD